MFLFTLAQKKPFPFKGPQLKKFWRTHTNEEIDSLSARTYKLHFRPVMRPTHSLNWRTNFRMLNPPQPAYPARQGQATYREAQSISSLSYSLLSHWRTGPEKWNRHSRLRVVGLEQEGPISANLHWRKKTSPRRESRTPFPPLPITLRPLNKLGWRT